MLCTLFIMTTKFAEAEFKSLESSIFEAKLLLQELHERNTPEIRLPTKPIYPDASDLQTVCNGNFGRIVHNGNLLRL
jgi:hypothetical protein